MGDVEQAFTNGRPLRRKNGPLFVRQPKEGLPGVEPGVLIELVKTVYGLMDGSKEWLACFLDEARKVCFVASRLEPSVLFLRKGSKYHSVLGVAFGRPGGRR
jgi:hypothetical protein